MSANKNEVLETPISIDHLADNQIVLVHALQAEAKNTDPLDIETHKIFSEAILNHIKAYNLLVGGLVFAESVGEDFV